MVCRAFEIICRLLEDLICRAIEMLYKGQSLKWDLSCRPLQSSRFHKPITHWRFNISTTLIDNMSSTRKKMWWSCWVEVSRLSCQPLKIDVPCKGIENSSTWNVRWSLDIKSRAFEIVYRDELHACILNLLLCFLETPACLPPFPSLSLSLVNR